MNVLSVHGELVSIKLDHITSHVLHLNSPGATSGFIALFTIIIVCSRYINLLGVTKANITIIKFFVGNKLNVARRMPKMWSREKRSYSRLSFTMLEVLLSVYEIQVDINRAINTNIGLVLF